MRSILGSLFRRAYSTKNAANLKICIVGAGPAGFYAAQYLMTRLQNFKIDIYEKLPVPFGLVRYGVAPDHPNVRNVINTFTKTAENPNVNFIGHVNLGTDVTFDLLKKCYHVVLLTYGVDENRTLGIPGENLDNVVPARKIVNWYNGLPRDTNLKIDLSVECATIFGQGNVAIDVARMLLTPISELKKTDITQYALDAIAQSKIKKIHLIGRRGPLQAAFAAKELREMLKLENCSTVWRKNDFNDVSDHLEKLPRPRKRITELMLNSLDKEVVEGNKIFNPIFFRSPTEILGKTSPEKVVLTVNKLEGDDIINQKAIPTDQIEEIDTGLVITSLGYKSVQADQSLPFDHKAGTVKHVKSRVERGVYAAGWLATGPHGIIISTMNSAFGVADRILRDIESEQLLDEERPDFEEIKKVLSEKNVQIVDWDGWKKIDEYEKACGKKVGKPRERVVDIEEMLRIADC